MKKFELTQDAAATYKLQPVIMQMTPSIRQAFLDHGFKVRKVRTPRGIAEDRYLVSWVERPSLEAAPRRARRPS